MCRCRLVTCRLQHISLKFKIMISGPNLKVPLQSYVWLLAFWTECNVEYFMFSRSCCLFMLIQHGTLRYVRRVGRFCRQRTSVIMLAVTHLRTISQPLGHRNLFHNHGARNSASGHAKPSGADHRVALGFIDVFACMWYSEVESNHFFSLEFALVKVDAC